MFNFLKKQKGSGCCGGKMSNEDHAVAKKETEKPATGEKANCHPTGETTTPPESKKVKHSGGCCGS